MKTLTLLEAQADLAGVFDLNDQGQDICVERSLGTRFRLALTPVVETSEAPFVWPDFAARRRRIFGDKIMPSNPVLEERESYDR